MAWHIWFVDISRVYVCLPKQIVLWLSVQGKLNSHLHVLVLLLNSLYMKVAKLIFLWNRLEVWIWLIPIFLFQSFFKISTSTSSLDSNKHLWFYCGRAAVPKPHWGVRLWILVKLAIDTGLPHCEWCCVFMKDIVYLQIPTLGCITAYHISPSVQTYSEFFTAGQNFMIHLL